MKPRRAILVAPPDDLAGSLAAALLRRHRAALPDLSAVTVLVPVAAAVRGMRASLGAASRGALLGPHIATLAQFAAERGAAPPPLPATECRLILADALRRYRGLFAGQDVWEVAEALYTLFEELSLNAARLPEDGAAFAAQLAQVYGATALAALSREAQIVHTLWQAYVQDTEGRSPAAAYCTALRSAFEAVAEDEAVYLAGFDLLTGGERAALDCAVADTLEIWLHGRRSGRDGAATATFCAELGLAPEPAPAAAPAFLDRMLAEAPARWDGAAPGIRITAAEDSEHEARCADLAVRQALLAGAREVVVVTQERRLARRLRALLERAGVALLDHGGWALSTSAAAAVLNAWLDAVERGFHFRPLLDLLKSGFFQADPAAVQSLERDLVYGRGIEAGLQQFRNAATAPALLALLERLSFAARAVPPLSRPRRMLDWLLGVERSLGALGVWPRWQEDAAGQRLSETFRELAAALTRRPQTAEWQDFRALLERDIERATFVPPAASGGAQVRLLTLEQCALLRCDALILAGASAGGLPGTVPAQAFFNQSVRAELGLPDFRQQHALGLARLRRVLDAAPQVQITYAPQQPGEPAQLCPWIEAIESRAAASGLDLRNPALAACAGSAAAEISTAAALPALQRSRPAPAAAPDRLPQRISATTHQLLVDCPYRFFVAACLDLQAEAAPDEDPDRSDYGQRVHRILEAFTRAVPGLPAPFVERVDAASRERAQARLLEIAEAVFAADLRAHALAQLWVKEFRDGVPALLDWLAARAPAEVAAEVAFEQPFDGRLLIGKADRVETGANGSLTVVDYKTGRTPAAADVESGEAVQLPHYALLDPRVAAVEYLPLRAGERALRIDEDLAVLRAAVAARLRRTLQQLDAGAPLAALGDAASCARCEYRGLCRQGDWHEPA